jgi:hypothetical protein
VCDDVDGGDVELVDNVDVVDGIEAGGHVVDGTVTDGVEVVIGVVARVVEVVVVVVQLQSQSEDFRSTEKVLKIYCSCRSACSLSKVQRLAKRRLLDQPPTKQRRQRREQHR